MQIPDEQAVDVLIDWLQLIKYLITEVTYNQANSSDIKLVMKELKIAIIEVNELWPKAISYNSILPPILIMHQTEKLIKFFEAINEDTSKTEP